MLRSSPISRDFSLESLAEPSVTWAAQMVSMLRHAYIQQKAHLEMRMSYLLRSVQAFEDKDVGEGLRMRIALAVQTWLTHVSLGLSVSHCVRKRLVMCVSPASWTE